MIEKMNQNNQEVKIFDRSSITLSGINKIISFNDEEFLLESLLGNIHVKGNILELMKMDTSDGIVKIKGNINSLVYIDGQYKEKEEGIIAKLFK